MPVHPASYAMGIALAPLLLSVPSLVFFGVLAASWGVMTLASTVWTVLALLIAWAAMSAIGFMISTYLFKASMMVLNNLSNLLGIGLIFIPPVYYPETLLGSLSWISMLIPTSNVAGLIRAYMGLLPLSAETIMIRWLILIVTTVVFVVLTSLKARWRET